MLQLQEKTLGHYTLQERIARGGMSEVYLATDERTQSLVAIKVVHRSDNDHFARFQREIKMLSSLSHKHILPVLEYGEHDAWYYCVTPYIEQGTLRNRIAQGPLSETETGQILTQIASALQFAHARGILHRDIKPSNMLLRADGHVYLADFGLAKGIGEASDLTQTGCLIGTPEYMAPELAEQPASVSSDIYALGVVLYQMLTGQVPFKGHTPLAIYWKHIQEQPTPPSVLNPAISISVEQVVLKALAKNPADRFTTVQELVEAYARALRACEQTAPDVFRNVKVQRIIPVFALRKQRAHPAVVALLAMLLLLGSLTLGFSSYSSQIGGQAPFVLGASAQFAATYHQPREFPPIPKPSLQLLTRQQVVFTSEQGSQSSSSNKGHPGRGHGHGHGHHGH